VRSSVIQISSLRLSYLIFHLTSLAFSHVLFLVFAPREFIYPVFRRFTLSASGESSFFLLAFLSHRDFCTFPFLLPNILTIDFSTFITSALYISSCSSYFSEDTCNCLRAAISSNFLYLRLFLSSFLLALFSTYKLVSFSRSTSTNPICFLLLNFLCFLLRVYQVSISHFISAALRRLSTLSFFPLSISPLTRLVCIHEMCKLCSFIV